jgi:hypothetical protein
VFTDPDGSAETMFSADDFAVLKATWVYSSPFRSPDATPPHRSLDR